MVAPVVEGRVGEDLLDDVVRRSRPFEREEEELGLERRRLLPEPRHEGATRGIGHVRREDEMRVRQRPDDRRLDALVLRDRLGELHRAELGHLPVVPLAEGCRICFRLVDCRIDARVIDSLEEIGEVPRNLFRPRDLCGRHAPETSDGRVPHAWVAAAARAAHTNAPRLSRASAPPAHPVA